MDVLLRLRELIVLIAMVKTGANTGSNYRLKIIVNAVYNYPCDLHTK